MPATFQSSPWTRGCRELVQRGQTATAASIIQCMEGRAGWPVVRLGKAIASPGSVPDSKSNGKESRQRKYYND